MQARDNVRLSGGDLRELIWVSDGKMGLGVGRKMLNPQKV